MRRLPGVDPAIRPSALPGPGSAPSARAGALGCPSSPPRARLALGLAALLLVPLAACASAPPIPESEAARAVAATRAAAERTAAQAEAESEAPAPARREVREPVREKLVVVDAGGRDRARTPGELSAAARADRERHGDRSVGELNDGNLAEMAARGKVTFAGGVAGGALAGDAPADGEATGDGEAGGAAGQSTATAESEAEDACDETCWRRRVLELRQAWADTAEQVAELEDEVAEQRWRFYSTDDPWIRDSRVKPAWDRALDRLRSTREEADRYRERVADLLEEGRRAGALPGWLREGVHLEPRSEDEEEGRDPSEPREPDVLQDYSRQPDQP